MAKGVSASLEKMPTGGLRKKGTPNIDPQRVGSPYNKDPKKVPPKIVNPQLTMSQEITEIVRRACQDELVTKSDKEMGVSEDRGYPFGGFL